VSVNGTTGSGAAAERAALLLGVGSAAEALELVAPFLAGEDDPAPYVVAVSALLTLDRPAEAAAVADTALAAFGPVPLLFRAASYAYRAAGDPQRALEVARWGVQHSPQWVPGLLALVEAECATGDLDAAERTLAAAVALAPGEPTVWLLTAELAAARGRTGDARRHLLTALRADPGNAPAMRGLGLLDEHRSRYGSAARWYAAALRLRPGDQELGTRVRALFGRFLGTCCVALLVVGLLVFTVFMAQADPVPGAPSGGPAATVLGWLCFAGLGGLVVGSAWFALRGVPRVVLAALAAEARSYRRVRRCARLTAAHAVLVAATALAAAVPVGEPRERLMVVFPLWFASMVAMVWLCIALRLTFGYGQTRPARAHPRDRLPA
jgi:tetratricopeptide (TPR) repeat protein